MADIEAPVQANFLMDRAEPFGNILDQTTGRRCLAVYVVNQPSVIAAHAKAGVVLAASFSGSPQKAVITFLTPFADSSYVISLAGTDGRNMTYESKTAAGFTINLNADTPITGEVSWEALTAGET